MTIFAVSFGPRFASRAISATVFFDRMSKKILQWGCFGFDSIRHWTVSTSGSVGQPVNLDLQPFSWQQLLCTRCVVC